MRAKDTIRLPIDMIIVIDNIVPTKRKRKTFTYC